MSVNVKQSLEGTVSIGRPLSVHAYPSLTEAEKNALFELCNNYLAEVSTYEYSGTARRDDYCSKEAYTEDGKVKVNCGLFAQLVWGGISPITFRGKQDTFDGTLEKKFDWGYAFKFPYTKAKGLTASDGKLYGFVQPNPDTLEGSYSFNSFYSEIGDPERKQVFKSFTGAGDMALELYMMGCEVPISDIQQGDMIFFQDAVNGDNKNDYTQHNFRDICHAGIVGRVYPEENDFMLIESDNYFTDSITFSSFSQSTGANTITRLSALHRRIVMVARHPHAFGKGGNVGTKFTLVE